MVLGFMLHIKGKRNFFVAKIWKSLRDNVSFSDMVDFLALHEKKFGSYWEIPPIGFKSKDHTIRAGKRWKAGMFIDFFINTRTSKMFRFAPKIKATFVQTINISYTKNDKKEDVVWIKIDGKVWTIAFLKRLHLNKALYMLATRDGFESSEDFLAYFNTDFEGQLIHWTDKPYYT